jgi:hypothetical protein
MTVAWIASIPRDRFPGYAVTHLMPRRSTVPSASSPRSSAGMALVKRVGVARVNPDLGRQLGVPGQRDHRPSGQLDPDIDRRHGRAHSRGIEVKQRHPA